MMRTNIMFMHKEHILHRIEELVLLVIILLNLLELFEPAPADVLFLKNIISWTVLGYLVYKVDICSILFGAQQRDDEGRRKYIIDINLGLIFAYLLLILKNVLLVANISIGEAYVFSGLMSYLKAHAASVNLFSFYAGGTLILILSLYIARYVRIGRRSVLGIFHEDGRPPRSFWSFALRLISVYFVIISFFMIIFNIMFEWLAMAVDAPLLLLGIFFYLFIIVRYHVRFSAESLIFKLGNLGEDFYGKVIGLFRGHKTISLGIAGVLVLHLLTDIANFILPYLLGAEEALYLSQLPAKTHMPILHLMHEDFAQVTTYLAKAALALQYLGNIICMLMLLALPALIWYRFYRRRIIRIPRIVLSLFFASVVSYAFNPVFTIRPLKVLVLAGTDIMTRSVLESAVNPILGAAAMVFAGAVVYLVQVEPRIRRWLIVTAMSIIYLFFVYYVGCFIISLGSYYVFTINLLVHAGMRFIAFFMASFWMVTIIFYISGTIIFLLEERKEYLRIR